MADCRVNRVGREWRFQMRLGIAAEKISPMRLKMIGCIASPQSENESPATDD